MDDPELSPCQCGCGEMVPGRWKRGHAIRGKGGYQPEPLPGPDDPEVDEPVPDDPSAYTPGWLTSTDDGMVSDPAGRPDELAEDPAPAHVKSVPPARGRGRPKGSGTRQRMTAAVRSDVKAKIRFMLQPAGRVWYARDPLCGATFVHQEPEISEALAEIVCDSPDLVAWFTGPAGGFMKYFSLAMACQPVAMTIWAHHIAHSIGTGPQPGPGYARPDYAGQAA